MRNSITVANRGSGNFSVFAPPVVQARHGYLREGDFSPITFIQTHIPAKTPSKKSHINTTNTITFSHLGAPRFDAR